MDTIFALATASGKAGIAVIRISGPEALSAVGELGASLGVHDRRLVRLKDHDGMLLDEAFALSFAPGRSFTGEQVVELQTHGSPAIVSAIFERLGQLGLRLANPGEFTRRAMENGIMDLDRVEGLADLIEAETEGQRRQAVRVFDGALGELVEGWRTKLVRAAALIEATIDFVDEDVPVDVYPEVRNLISEVAAEVRSEAQGVAIRERVREGFEVALVGPPNSGKSTLLNRLAGREAAMTSDIEGTTRDVIEVRMDLQGLPVTVLDTAGLRKSDDVLEEMGIERGRQRAARADIRIHLSADGVFSKEVFDDGLDIYVRSKADIAPSENGLAVSARTGDGIAELLDKVSGHLSRMVAGAGVASRVRHQLALQVASERLVDVLGALDEDDGFADLVAENIRQAARALDSLIGRIDVENVLDDIFASFCIGK